MRLLLRVTSSAWRICFGAIRARAVSRVRDDHDVVPQPRQAGCLQLRLRCDPAVARLEGILLRDETDPHVPGRRYRRARHTTRNLDGPLSNPSVASRTVNAVPRTCARCVKSGSSFTTKR